MPNWNGPAVFFFFFFFFFFERGGTLHGQQPVPHLTLPRLTSIQSSTPASTPGEDTPTSPSDLRRHTTRGATDTGYTLSLYWWRKRSSDLTGRDPRISLDSYCPPQSGQLPASKVLSRHCLPSSLGAWGYGTTRKADWNHGTRKPQTKLSKKTSFETGVLKCPDNDDGLSTSLQDIKDSRKTAVINDELKRLNLDIATFQETRLADSGTLKEKDYTFFWQGSSESME